MLCTVVQLRPILSICTVSLQSGLCRQEYWVGCYSPSSKVNSIMSHHSLSAPALNQWPELWKAQCAKESPELRTRDYAKQGNNENSSLLLLIFLRSPCVRQQKVTLMSTHPPLLKPWSLWRQGTEKLEKNLRTMHFTLHNKIDCSPREQKEFWLF